MGAYTEFCRTLADWLQLPAKLIVIAFPTTCDDAFDYAGRNELPTEHFVSVGSCNKTTGIITATVKDLIEALNSGLNYAFDDAYMLFTFNDVNKMTQDNDATMHDIIVGLNNLNIRPIVMSFEPYKFLNSTNFYYNDMVLIRRTWGASIYDNAMPMLNSYVLNTQSKNLSMLDINANLGNAPLISSKPLIFSTPQNQFADMLAIGMLCYGSYNLYSQYKKRLKLKVG